MGKGVKRKICHIVIFLINIRRAGCPLPDTNTHTIELLVFIELSFLDKNPNLKQEKPVFKGFNLFI